MDTIQADLKMAVEAARWAPSVLNSQPWRFAVRDGLITLRADADRRLEADQAGREMLISCGAALFTLRVAIRRLGREPVVRALPDPDRPHLLAEVSLGEPPADTAQADRLYGQIRVRRSHRGAFHPKPMSAALATALRDEARREGAILHIASDEHTKAVLAGLTIAAQHVHHLNPRHAAEPATWAPAPQILVLTTRQDRPADWIAAGQALQRVLLTAALTENLSAGFHTQPLKIPELRTFLSTRCYHGEHPQVLFRLGVPTTPPQPTTRRPPNELNGW